jgi:hypothetical protein
MKGFKTLGFNVVVAAAAAVLPILASTDWTAYVSPTIAMLIVTGVNIALRFVTTTPVLSDK